METVPKRANPAVAIPRCAPSELISPIEPAATAQIAMKREARGGRTINAIAVELNCAVVGSTTVAQRD
jgi:hypothetical protein